MAGQDDIAALTDLAQRLIPGDDPGPGWILHHPVGDIAQLDRSIDADAVDLQLHRRYALHRRRRGGRCRGGHARCGEDDRTRPARAGARHLRQRLRGGDIRILILGGHLHKR